MGGLKMPPEAPPGYEYYTTTTLSEICTVIDSGCWALDVGAYLNVIPGDEAVLTPVCLGVTGGCLAQEWISKQVPCADPTLYVYKRTYNLGVGPFVATVQPPKWHIIPECP